MTSIEHDVHCMEPKIEWSRTRKNLFFKCPRAWYLRYGYKSNSTRSRVPSFQRPWDLMLRAMKETLLDRLDDLKEGKEWSSLLVEVQLKSSLQSHLDGSVHRVSEQTQNALLKFSQHRFRLLWRTRILQQLQKRRHAQWYVLDRSEPTQYGIRRLYVTPDLVIRIQNRWHLVRFDMQKSPPRVHDESEANVMVFWALNNDGFSAPGESYRLHTVGWRQGFWHCETFQPTSQSIKQSQQLLEQDMKAMEEISRYGMRNLSLLPLAKSKRTCTSCFYRKFCPGGENLELAKKEQAVLELSAHSLKARN